MDDKTITDLVRRVQRLERETVRFRRGVVTATSPPAVALGGSDVSYENVAVVNGIGLTEGEHVAVLTWGNDLLVLGVLA